MKNTRKIKHGRLVTLINMAPKVKKYKSMDSFTEDCAKFYQRIATSEESKKVFDNIIGISTYYHLFKNRKQTPYPHIHYIVTSNYKLEIKLLEYSWNNITKGKAIMNIREFKRYGEPIANMLLMMEDYWT